MFWYPAGETDGYCRKDTNFISYPHGSHLILFQVKSSCKGGLFNQFALFDDYDGPKVRVHPAFKFYSVSLI